MEAPWRPDPADDETDEQVDYATLTYQVTGRVARITFNRPDQGNAITRDTPPISRTRSSGPTSTRGCT